ncbi:acyl-CoA dehydrogenase family protein [Cupriavidus sp. TMH.W2]|uniref:acyl-CoA dehydrogenase family protein n=1 Tax=Cupriavidus sp. TMH.W2 TaxID=3434465 RepID=UPI003D77ADF1
MIKMPERGLACDTSTGNDQRGLHAAVDAMTSEGENQDLRQRVREVCAAFAQAYFRDVDRHQGQPEEFAGALREAGLANALVPMGDGGMGLSLAQTCAIVEEIGVQGAPAAGLIQEICNHRLLVTYGCGELVEWYAKQIIDGELRAPAIAFQNRPVDAMAVTGCCPDGVTVNGRSARVSRAQNSDLLLLLVETDFSSPVKESETKYSLYLVDLRATVGRGLTIHPSRSLENHDFSDIVVRNLLLPTAWRIGAEGEGARYISERCHVEMVLSAAAAIGDAIWFLRHAHDPATGVTAMENIDWQCQKISSNLAKAAASIEVARLMCARAAHRYDHGMACEAEARMALAFALDATGAAVECCLGMGRRSDPGSQEDVDRKLRETRQHQVMPFLAQSVLSYIGEQVLGLASPH